MSGGRAAGRLPPGRPKDRGPIALASPPGPGVPARTRGRRGGGLGSVAAGMVDVEVVELAGRAVAPELGGVELEARALQEVLERGAMGVGHRLLDAVGAQARDLATDVEHRLVDRIAEIRPGVAADDEMARLRHEGAHVADRAAHHDIDALHRDAAARAGVALDHQQPAPARGAGGLRGVAGEPHHPGHDVLGQPLAGVAVDDDARRLVHAGAVVADVALDRDLDRLGQADRDRMRAAWIEHPPGALVGVGGQRVECAVELAHRGVVQIDGAQGSQCRAQL